MYIVVAFLTCPLRKSSRCGAWHLDAEDRRSTIRTSRKAQIFCRLFFSLDSTLLRVELRFHGNWTQIIFNISHLADLIQNTSVHRFIRHLSFVYDWSTFALITNDYQYQWLIISLNSPWYLSTNVYTSFIYKINLMFQIISVQLSSSIYVTNCGTDFFELQFCYKKDRKASWWKLKHPFSALHFRHNHLTSLKTHPAKDSTEQTFTLTRGGNPRRVTKVSSASCVVFTEAWPGAA